LGEQIDEALQDANQFYFRDFMGRTPLQIAMDSQNETAWTTIINSCEYSDKVFMTISDVLQLIPETAPLVTLAFDTLFQPSEFLDNSSNLHKGLLKASRGDWFSGAEEGDKVIFFTTAGKYLTYKQSSTLGNDTFVGLQEEPTIKGDIKSMTMQTKPRELNKIEFRTLQFPCDLRPGSSFSTELLNALSDSKNKELVRSEMKLVLEFKWDQLKNMVFLQNFELFAYVVFLLLCKTDVILAPLALLVFTVIIAVPEAF